MPISAYPIKYLVKTVSHFYEEWLKINQNELAKLQTIDIQLLASYENMSEIDRETYNKQALQSQKLIQRFNMLMMHTANEERNVNRMLTKLAFNQDHDRINVLKQQANRTHNFKLDEKDKEIEILASEKDKEIRSYQAKIENYQNKNIFQKIAMAFKKEK